MAVEELTVEMAIERKLTPIDCVRYYKEDISDEDADFILWEETCYPMSHDFLKQLYNKFKP